MKLIDRLTKKPEYRSSLSDVIAAWGAGEWSTNGNAYPITQTYTPGQKIEMAEQSFAGHSAEYAGNSAVFACVAFRASVFSEARFQFQQIRQGRPGDLFGDPALEILEHPWPNGTTGELLTRMSNDTDLAGNFYAYRDGNELYRLRPDWVDIVLDRPADQWDAKPLAYIYWEGGRRGGRNLGKTFFVDEICHWSPKPDPIACYRGMSPLTPLVREVQGDWLLQVHKNSFLQNAATPNMIVKSDATTSYENFLKFKELFEADHEGAHNAYKTLHIGGGADVTVVGTDMKALDVRNLSSANEARIAAAFEVPAILIGFIPGLDASTYSNYGMARRRYADGTERPRLRSAAAALATVVPAPADSRLWYDDRDIAFFREDKRDEAEIRQMEAATMRQLVDAGYEPKTVTDAVISGDYKKLVHTGLFSVQLQPPGSQMSGSTASQVVSSTN